MKEEHQIVESAVSRIVRHEIVRLLVLSALAVLAFFLTRAAAARNRAIQAETAAVWYQKGQRALASGEGESALEAFRRAAANEHNNRTYELALAEALAAAHREGEARQVLLRMREATPEDPKINMQLARLAAGRGDVSGATRYYHSAIYGVWEADPRAHRLEARLELIDFLVLRGAKAEAQSELILLAGDMPDDALLHARVGELFLKSSEPERALEEFRKALRGNANLPQALAGAGRAAFELRNYSLARQYLERSLQHQREDSSITELLETTRLILEIDPFQRRLALSQKRVRVRRAFEQATGRLKDCIQALGSLADGAPPQELHVLSVRVASMQPQVRESTFRRDPDVMNAILDLVFEIEAAAESHCGAPSALDRALVAIGRNHVGSTED